MNWAGRLSKEPAQSSLFLCYLAAEHRLCNGPMMYAELVFAKAILAIAKIVPPWANESFVIIQLAHVVDALLETLPPASWRLGSSAA